MVAKHLPSSSSSSSKGSNDSSSSVARTVAAEDPKNTYLTILENEVLSPKSSLVHLRSQSLYTSWTQALQGGSPGGVMARVSDQSAAVGPNYAAQPQNQPCIAQQRTPLSRLHHPPMIRVSQTQSNANVSVQNQQNSGIPSPSLIPIKISYDDIEDELHYWETFVVCYVLGANPPLHVIDVFVKRI